MFGFFSTLALIGTGIAGWLLRDEYYLTAEHGFGYWLGVIGASLMLLLMLYPLAKNYRFLSSFIEIKHWFKFHMLLGLLGPLAILFHCNFHFGSTNSNVALVTMLVVMFSGLIGRYFYRHLHIGLYGKKIEIASLQSDLSHKLLSLNQSSPQSHIHIILEQAKSALVSGNARLNKRSAKVLLREVKQLNQQSSNNRQLNQDLSTFALKQKQYSRILRYDYLFGLWHVVHLPLFFLMLFAGSLHTIAVHLY